MGTENDLGLMFDISKDPGTCHPCLYLQDVLLSQHLPAPPWLVSPTGAPRDCFPLMPGLSQHSQTLSWLGPPRGASGDCFPLTLGFCILQGLHTKVPEPFHELKKNSIILNLMCLYMCLKYASTCVYVNMNACGGHWKTLCILLSVCPVPLSWFSH